MGFLGSKTDCETLLPETDSGCHAKMRQVMPGKLI